ncbi:hypothetical protein PQO01_10125 [Lentisphaera marina]|nr:hypothetical protein [Lentisphaera marina]MDD7985309.1 hypothetical protein [Lentisphaera marina]
MVLRTRGSSAPRTPRKDLPVLDPATETLPHFMDNYENKLREAELIED